MSLSYTEQMNRIKSDELLEGLVAYGLFAEKIPPFLSAENFFNFARSFTHDQNSNFGKNNYVTDFIQYESIRNINIPRELAIPNPISYFNLCKCLSDYWDELKQHFKKNTDHEGFKTSRIHIRKIKDKKYIFKINNYGSNGFFSLDTKIKKELFCMSYKDYGEDDNPFPNILINKRFVVNADISNCFGSIYTHALPWALVGKETAKKNRKRGWYNDIDKYTMNLKNGETHGILTGCHASNLLSEIILVVIDNCMREQNYEYIRNIDDYTCYVETFEKAEEFLIDLSNELKKFGLSLNHKKTKIESLPLVVSTHWVRELLYISDRKFFDFIAMQYFLDNIIKLMSNNQDNAAIMNYAIKILSKKRLSKAALDYYVDMIHHLILIYPYLISLLEKFIFNAHGVSEGKIKEIANSIYNYGVKKKSNEVVGYALYFSIRYKFYFDKLNPYNYAKDSNDCVVLLLSFIYDKRRYKNLEGARIEKYKNIAEKLYDKGAGMDKFWLFIYEVFSEQEFSQSGDIDWECMKKKNISFIKSNFLEFTPKLKK